MFDPYRKWLGIPEDSRLNLKGYEWLREQYESAEGQDKIEKVRQLTKIAEEIGCSMSQLALAWCLKNPDVSTVITGASRPEQVAENMQAIDVAEQLAPPVLERIEAILDNKPEPEEDSR